MMKDGYRNLLSIIVGSRGSFRETVGSDINLRHLVYYGDQRDAYGPVSDHHPYGTQSFWPLPWFFDKVCRFQWEPLEVLFGHPVNLLHFDPILLHLWQEKEKLVCLEMGDKVLERGVSEIRAGLRDMKEKDKYDRVKVARGFDMMECSHKLVEYGVFRPQGVKWPRSVKVLNGAYSKKSIRKFLKSTQVHILQDQQEFLRPPTDRERARGEEPKPPVLGVLSPERRKRFRAIFDKILNKLWSGEAQTRLSEQDVLLLLQGFSGKDRAPDCKKFSPDCEVEEAEEVEVPRPMLHTMTSPGAFFRE